jgi:hypothetical protein
VRVSLLALTLVLTASGATAEGRRWLAQFQAGRATLHEWDPSGAWYEARVGRSLSGRVLSADVGLVLSGAAEGYASLTAGFEVLPFPRGVLSPFARVEAGAMWEPEYGGYIAGVGGGLALRLDDRLSLRGGASWGLHGDIRGPVVYSAGLQVRW